jgi:hypothetical protein
MKKQVKNTVSACQETTSSRIEDKIAKIMIDNWKMCFCKQIMRINIRPFRITAPKNKCEINQLSVDILLNAMVF